MRFSERWWFLSGLNAGIAFSMFCVIGALRGAGYVGFFTGIVAAYLLWLSYQWLADKSHPNKKKD
jgi:hypothetical protein